MIGDARARVDACVASRAFRRPACPSRRASWNGRANVAGHSRAPRRRRWKRAGAGVLGRALLLVALALQSEAQSRLGRLFSDPEQRTELDRLRSEVGVTASGEPVAGPVESESRPGPDGGPPQHAATFNGLVVRGDGHRVAWFDGVETVPGTTTPTGVRIDAARPPGPRLRLRLPDGRTSAVLAPGQSIDTEGRVRDAYERGSTGTAAGAAGGRPEDSGGVEEGADAGTPVGSPGSDSPAALPADLVRELLRATRAASAPLGESVSGAPSAGDGPPMERHPAGVREAR